MTIVFNKTSKIRPTQNLMMLPEAIRTKPTTGTNLACFTRDKVSTYHVCPQGTCET